MSLPTFDQLMQGFGVVTVMNVCIYEKNGTYTNTASCCHIGDNDDSAFTPDGWTKTGETIDTLKIMTRIRISTRG